MIENRAQSVHIAMAADLAVARTGLLGRHEIRRAQHLTGEGEAGFTIEAFGQAEIRHSWFIGTGIDQHIGRFEIPMENALPMGIVDRLGDPLHIASGGRRRKKRTASRRITSS